MNKTFIELFAGVGGFRVGLNNVQKIDEQGKAIEQRDWKCVYMNQWEPSTKKQHAFDCYVERFGNCGECCNEDISIIDKKLIPDASLLVGGFPCQDYSVARSLKNEMGIEGKKGVLFWDIAEILRIKKIPFVLLENVDRLLISPSKKRGRDFSIILKTLDCLGYNVDYRVINAADYGMPQRRKRVFLFAYRKDTKYAKREDKQSIFDVFPTENDVRTSTIDLRCFRDAMDIMEAEETPYMNGYGNAGRMQDGVITVQHCISQKKEMMPLNKLLETQGIPHEYYLTDIQIEKMKYLKGSKRIPRIRKDGTEWIYSEGAMTCPDSLFLPGRTMLTSEGTVNRSTHIVEDKETRKWRFLTPIEAERLQMFPDNWTKTDMTDKKRYFMMGNALVTGVISRLEPPIRRIVENE